MGRHRIDDSRVCSQCKNDFTHKGNHRLKNGTIKAYDLWHSDNKGGYLCQYCYSMLIHNQTRIKFKGKKKPVGFNPRVGVCNYCRAVVPFDCKQTQMHHEQYHYDNILKDTIELCASCHSAIPIIV